MYKFVFLSYTTSEHEDHFLEKLCFPMIADFGLRQPEFCPGVDRANRKFPVVILQQKDRKDLF